MEERSQDRGYFRRIAKELASGGREALLHHLLHVKYSKDKIASVPKSAALQDQKMLSLNLVDKWWHSRLEEGTACSLDDDWNNEVPSRVLHDDFVDFARKAGQSRRATVTELGARLKTLVPGIQKLRRTLTRLESEKYRGYVYVFPSLDECREAFERLLGSTLEWPPEAREISPLAPAPSKRRAARRKKRKRPRKKTGR